MAFSLSTELLLCPYFKESVAISSEFRINLSIEISPSFSLFMYSPEVAVAALRTYSTFVAPNKIGFIPERGWFIWRGNFFMMFEDVG